MMEFEQHPTEPDTLVIKMPKRYIAKHSDEDLRAAVLAEREACAKVAEKTYDKQIVQYSKGYYVDPNKMGEYSEQIVKRCAAAIRARSKHEQN